MKELTEITSNWKKKSFKPVYWLEGDEPYFIDQLTHFAEHNILSEEEANFNLNVFYGKEASALDVLSICQRYPVFAERQVVIIKEAQQMKDVQKLEGYFQTPNKTTLLLIAYKDKKIDKRTSFFKILKSNIEFVSFLKLKGNQLSGWVQGLVNAKGFEMNDLTANILVEHIGNDLSRMGNEVNKILINLNGRKSITSDDVETYVGISKEYNLFELQAAVAKKQLAKAIQIIQYFKTNPKQAPMPLVLSSLHNFFSKAFIVVGQNSRNEKDIAGMIGVNPFFVKDYIHSTTLYGKEGITAALHLLYVYNLKSIGIHNQGTSDYSLLTELTLKIIGTKK